MALLLALMSGLTVALFAVAVLKTNRDTVVQARVGRLGVPERSDPYETSFLSRVMLPVSGRFAMLVGRLLPGRIARAVDTRLETAGRPIATSKFLTLWVALAVILPIALLLVTVIGNGRVGGSQALVVLVWAVLGTVMPWLWLSSKARTRSRAVDRKLPDAVDLIVTNVEAGLGLQAALLAVSEKLKGPVAEEFARVVREISIGRSREEAIEEMAVRSGGPDMRLFARALAQAERNGIPIAGVLRNQAGEIRLRRRQRAREQAAKIPVKITIPTVLFIFPTIFLVLLGPVVLSVIDRFAD